MNTILAILAKPTTAVDAFRPIDEYAKEVLNQALTTKVYMCMCVCVCIYIYIYTRMIKY